MTSMWIPSPSSFLTLHSVHNHQPAVLPDVLHHSHPSQPAPAPAVALGSFQSLPPITTLSPGLLSPTSAAPTLSATYSCTTFAQRPAHERNIWYDAKPPYAIHPSLPSLPKLQLTGTSPNVRTPNESKLPQCTTLSTSSTITSASSLEQTTAQTQAKPQPQPQPQVQVQHAGRRAVEPTVLSAGKPRSLSQSESQNGVQPRTRRQARSMTKAIETRMTCMNNSKHLRKVFVCPVEGCSQTSSNKGNLSKHIATRHELRRDYVCPFAGCSRRFAKKYNMLRHLSASGVHPRSTRCAVPKRTVDAASGVLSSFEIGSGSSCKSGQAGKGKSWSGVNSRVRKRAAPRARWSAWELELAHFLAVQCVHYPPPRA